MILFVLEKYAGSQGNRTFYLVNRDECLITYKTYIYIDENDKNNKTRHNDFLESRIYSRICSTDFTNNLEGNVVSGYIHNRTKVCCLLAVVNEPLESFAVRPPTGQYAAISALAAQVGQPIFPVIWLSQ